MAQIPSRVKFRKSQRGSRAGNAQRGTKVSFGEFGLQAVDRGWLKHNQIEACRVAITRNLKRKGKVFIRVFPHKPVTARPPETRMGKGKGSPEFWVSVVLPGHMLFEVSGVPESLAKESFRLAANKIGIRTRFVRRDAHS
jgi:large subunit ribosomal protein L16